MMRRISVAGPTPPVSRAVGAVVIAASFLLGSTKWCVRAVTPKPSGGLGAIPSRRILRFQWLITCLSRRLYNQR
jgi:hypothetical protein